MIKIIKLLKLIPSSLNKLLNKLLSKNLSKFKSKFLKLYQDPKESFKKLSKFLNIFKPKNQYLSHNLINHPEKSLRQSKFLHTSKNKRLFTSINQSTMKKLFKFPYKCHLLRFLSMLIGFFLKTGK
jgi:hypothetical protein